MVMLHAYMDDSGSNAQSHACVVAGYFGGVRRWQEFERGWRRVLEQFGVKEFHARIFWRRTPEGEGVGEYRGWNKGRLDEFLRRLLDMIASVEIYPFACGVLRSEWNKLTTREQKILCGGIPPNLDEASTNAMFFPFQHAIAKTVQYCKPGMKMQFFFDHNQLTNPWAGICYKRLRDIAIQEGAPHFAAKMNGINFSDSKEALPLQAADLLAWEAYKYAKTANGDKKFPAGPVYRRALTRIRDKEDFRLFDHVRLQVFVPRLLSNRDTVRTYANTKGKTAQ